MQYETGHTVGNILKRSKNKTKSCSWAYKYDHSGRKSNFGLNIACLWKQPVTNIGFLVRQTGPSILKGFQSFLSVCAVYSVHAL